MTDLNSEIDKIASAEELKVSAEEFGVAADEYRKTQATIFRNMRTDLLKVLNSINFLISAYEKEVK